MRTDTLAVPAAAARAGRLKEIAYGVLLTVIPSMAVSISLFEITASVFMGLCVLAMWRDRDASPFRGALAVWMAVYLAAAALSFTQTEYPYASLRGIFRVFRGLLFCLSVAYAIDDAPKAKRLFLWFLGVAFAMGLDAVFQGFTGRDLVAGRTMTPYSGDTRRLTGPFKHANDFSAYLSLVFFLFMGAAQDARAFPGIRARVFIWAGWALTTGCLVGTYARAAWLCVAVMLLLWAIVRRSRLVAALLAAGALWTLFLSPPLVRHRIGSLWREGGTVVERRELWGESLRMIRHSPLVGLGINTYSRNEPRFKAPGSKIDNQYAHNGYLQIAAEIGLLGLAAFLALLVYMLAGTVSALRDARAGPFPAALGWALVFGILAFLAHSAFDTNLQSLLLINLLWFCLGFAWAVRTIVRRGAAR